MPDEKPLKPEDFSVAAEGKQVKKQDGTPVALTPDPPLRRISPIASMRTMRGAKRKVVGLGGPTLVGHLAGRQQPILND
jgi:hypothetical protein